MSLTEEQKMKLMAWLDGELSEDQRQTFEREARDNPELRREMDSFRRIADDADQMRFADPGPAVWDAYWDNVRVRLGRGIGWTFLAIGGAILAAAAIYYFFSSAAHPAIKWAGGFSLAGGLILFLVVLRQRIREWKHDRYRKVRR